ncbi:uncharacterized protein [Anabrus simplex]|uniref:uncharacterized protein n=1 Tax=Anabrus simplex TaxID=316456 RepID=UPI0035A27FAB
MEKNRKCLVILLFILQISFGLGKYYVTLSHNGPVVSGANITLKAELFNIYDQSPNGTFSYSWKDNAIAQHFGETPDTNATVAYWNVSYPADIYPPGPYLAQVTVYEREFIRVACASQRVSYDITDMLNGQMELKQNGTRNTDGFVSNAAEVSHKISLSPPDFTFLAKNATSIFTYWFVDCVYYGYSTDFRFLFNYTEMRSYNVEALVVASFDEIPDTTVPPLTTTLEPISSTPVSPDHSNVTSLAASPNSTSVDFLSSVTEVNYILTKNTSVPYTSKYGTIFNNETVKLPFVCLNSSIIPRDITKVYGYFRRELFVKAPITNVILKGKQWLPAGEVFHLDIFCNGSGTFFHCMKIKPGVYNITGDETCASELSSEKCFMKLVHYFREPSTYTIVAIIRNDVSQIVMPFAIRMYEVTKQPQLSVIIVPVTFSVVAVILIVFGVAYYVQSQTRYTVEVADFDFGQANDMEYKTFHERLREGIMNVFNRSREYKEPHSSCPARRKYDNMDE